MLGVRDGDDLMRLRTRLILVPVIGLVSTVAVSTAIALSTGPKPHLFAIPRGLPDNVPPTGYFVRCWITPGCQRVDWYEQHDPNWTKGELYSSEDRFLRASKHHCDK